MIAQNPQRYFDAIDATWAPASFSESGPFLLREGSGGGKRVSAGTLNADKASNDDIANASKVMTSMGQPPLFMLKPGQEALDNQLETLGFSVVDPTVVYASPIENLAQHAPTGLAVIPGDIPLAAQKEIWATDNIGPARIAVMERSSAPKGYLLGRHEDRIAGTVFVSVDKDVAMLHALTVHERARRLGVGKNLTHGCAKWAMDRGAQIFALMTTRSNKPARALYESLGMQDVARYHYRIRSE